MWFKNCYEYQVISLFFSALDFSGPGVSNFIIFQGHKNPGDPTVVYRQHLCCLLLLRQELSLVKLWRVEALGKRKRKRSLVNLLLIWVTRFPWSVHQRKQRPPAEGSFQEWSGGSWVWMLSGKWERELALLLAPKGLSWGTYTSLDPFPINNIPRDNCDALKSGWWLCIDFSTQLIIE